MISPEQDRIFQRNRAIVSSILLACCIGGIVWLLRRPPHAYRSDTEIAIQIADDIAPYFAEFAREMEPFIRQFQDTYSDEVGAFSDRLQTATSNAVLASQAADRTALANEIRSLHTQRAGLTKKIAAEASTLRNIIRQKELIYRETRLSDMSLAFLLGIGSSLSAHWILIASRRIRATLHEIGGTT